MYFLLFLNYSSSLWWKHLNRELLQTCVLVEVTFDDDFSLTKKKKKKKTFELNDISAALPVYLVF